MDKFSEMSKKIENLDLSIRANPKGFASDFYKKERKFLGLGPVKKIESKVGNDLCCVTVPSSCIVYRPPLGEEEAKATNAGEEMVAISGTDAKNLYILSKFRMEKMIVHVDKGKEIKDAGICIIPKLNTTQFLFSDDFTNEILISSILWKNKNVLKAIAASICEDDITLAYTLKEYRKGMLPLKNYKGIEDLDIEALIKNIIEILNSIDVGQFIHAYLGLENVLYDPTTKKYAISNFSRSIITTPISLEDNVTVAWNGYQSPAPPICESVSTIGNYFTIKSNASLIYLSADARKAYDLYTFILSLLCHPDVRKKIMGDKEKLTKYFFTIWYPEDVSRIWRIVLLSKGHYTVSDIKEALLNTRLRLDILSVFK